MGLNNTQWFVVNSNAVALNDLLVARGWRLECVEGWKSTKAVGVAPCRSAWRASRDPDQWIILELLSSDHDLRIQVQYWSDSRAAIAFKTDLITIGCAEHTISSTGLADER